MNSEKSEYSKYIRLKGHTEFLNHFCSSKRQNSLHHAYILSGNIGIGKSFLARQLAAYLLQEEYPSALNEVKYDLDEVEYILSLNEDNAIWRQVFCHSHPDLVYLYANKSETNKSGQIKLEDIKSIANLTNHLSARGGWRIIIIDSLDKTNHSGANAILKVLEEPPEKTIFFLISHSLSKVTSTIRSRCQLVKLSPLKNLDSRLVLKQHIRDINDEEINLLETLCEGSPGMAMTIFNSGINVFFEKFNEILQGKGFQFENMLSLASNWGSSISKNPELSAATIFVFDKLFSQAALFSVNAHKNQMNNVILVTSSFLQIANILAESYTTKELAELHMEWQNEFREALDNYLDMGVFMQQSIYEIYSQTQLR